QVGAGPGGRREPSDLGVSWRRHKRRAVAGCPGLCAAVQGRQGSRVRSGGPSRATEAEQQFRNPKASLHIRLCDLLSHLQQRGERHCQEFYRALYIHAQPLHSHLPSRYTPHNSDCRELDWGIERRELSDRGPMSFLAGLGLAAGLALLLYCCPPDPKVLPGTRRVLAFSPVIIDRHASRYLLAFLADDFGGL
uniref:Caspase recruitment domain family, member 19 n=1 Tax=Rattus norvegicus TaxID=10116 RepID=A0A8I6A9W5_RAT